MAQDREERREQFKKAFGANKVEIIPADEHYQIDVHDRKERVGAYSRVSTMSGEQVESFEVQKLYYTKLIAQNPNWTMVGMYADEGISATSTKRRKGFLRLINDCMEGKVSLIVTKTVTRFARNLVDCVSTCRELKKLTPPVGVMFEADNIYTLDGQGEIHLALLAVVAQSDSETKSAAIKWAFRNRCAGGIPPFVKVYGYDIKLKRDLMPGEARMLRINQEQAAVVRMIYEQFLAGNPVSHIAKLLEKKGVPSPAGNPHWSQSTIIYILTNETYAGYLVRQKSLTVDLFSHKSIKNNGMLPQYKISDTHEGISPSDIWLDVQSRIYTRDWPEFSMLLDKSAPFPFKNTTLFPIKF